LAIQFCNAQMAAQDRVIGMLVTALLGTALAI
jgi:hypothetical protein